VFLAVRWSDAFINAAGKNSDAATCAAAFACLKAMVPPIKLMGKSHGVLFGRHTALLIEKLLRESVGVASNGTAVSGNAVGVQDIGVAGNGGAEYAIRFICLMIEKNCFRHIDSVMRKIEQRLNELKGILDVTVEFAAPQDSGFEKELRLMIKKRTGAADIKMKTKIIPELMGGYRLRIGGLCYDASLKGQLEKMTADLENL